MAHTIIVLDTDGATPLFTHITGPNEAEASKKARRVLRKHGMTVKNFEQVDVTTFMTQVSPDDTTEQWVKQATALEVVQADWASPVKPEDEFTRADEPVSLFPTHNPKDPYEGHLG